MIPEIEQKQMLKEVEKKGAKAKMLSGGKCNRQLQGGSKAGERETKVETRFGGCKSLDGDS